MPPGKAEYGEVSCWDLTTGKRLWQVRDSDAIFATTLFSPDGSVLSVQLASWAGHRIEAWDAATGKPRPGWQPRTGADIELRAFSPDGGLLLYTDGRLHAVNMRTGRDRYTVPISHGPVVFSPDGKSFVTAHRILRRWDTATGKPLWEDTAELGHDHPVGTLSFSPDGKRLASRDIDGPLLIWDLNSHKPTTRIDGRHYGSLTFAPDGRTVFAATDSARHTGEIVSLDLDSGKELTRFSTEGLFKDELGATLRNIRLTSDGRVAAMADLWDDEFQEDVATVSWDVKTGKVAFHLVLPADVGMDAVLAPDGRTVAGLDTIFDTRTKTTRRLRLEDREDAEPWQISPDGCFVAGAIHRRAPQRRYSEATPLGVGVWEMASGRLVGRLPLQKWESFRLVAGGRLLVVLQADRLALWDVVAGKEVLSRPAPKLDGPWEVLAMADDGKVAATGQALGTVLLWDLSGRGTGQK
jgi:WD40 repeat protein